MTRDSLEIIQLSRLSVGVLYAASFRAGVPDFALSLQVRAESYPPYPAKRIPDPTGQFCAFLVRTGGHKHIAQYGPIDVKLVKRDPSLPAFTPALASVYSNPGPWGSTIYETHDLNKVMPRPGDRVLGNLQLEKPPGGCLVSSKGRGIVVIDDYGYNHLVHDGTKPALRIITANGSTLHRFKLSQLFAPDDRRQVGMLGRFWDSAWIDDEAGSVVLVGLSKDMGPKHPPPIVVIDWVKGTVRTGSVRHIEMAIRSKNRSSLPAAIDLADRLNIRSLDEAIARIFADRQLAPRIRVHAAVYLASRGDRPARQHLIQAVKDLARLPSLHPNAVRSEDELVAEDYAFAVDSLAVVMGTDCLEVLNQIGIKHGFAPCIWAVYRELGSKGRTALIDLLRHSKAPDAQVFAAQMLGSIYPATTSTIRQLTEALSSSAVSTQGELLRVKAAEALGFIGPAAKTAVPKLKALLKDSKEEVRKTAQDALKAIEAAP